MPQFQHNPQQKPQLPPQKQDPLDQLLSQPDGVQLERFITYRLSVLTNRLNHQLEQLLKQQIELSLPEWRIVAVLGQFKDISVREIVKYSSMDKGLVSRTATKLVEKEIIHRQPHPTDNRLVTLSLTESGWQIYRKMTPLAQQRQIDLLNKLDKEQRIAIDQILDQLLAED